MNGLAANMYDGYVMAAGLDGGDQAYKRKKASFSLPQTKCCISPSTPGLTFTPTPHHYPDTNPIDPSQDNQPTDHPPRTAWTKPVSSVAARGFVPDRSPPGFRKRAEQQGGNQRTNPARPFPWPQDISFFGLLDLHFSRYDR